MKLVTVWMYGEPYNPIEQCTSLCRMLIQPGGAHLPVLSAQILSPRFLYWLQLSGDEWRGTPPPFFFSVFLSHPSWAWHSRASKRETRQGEAERCSARAYKPSPSPSRSPRQRTGRHRVYACGVSRAVGSSLTVAGSALCSLCLGALHCGSMRDVCVRAHVCKYLCPAEPCTLAMLSVGLSVSSPYHRLEKEPVLLCVSIKPLTGRKDHISHIWFYDSGFVRQAVHGDVWSIPAVFDLTVSHGQTFTELQLMPSGRSNSKTTSHRIH
jgi:hypothetical protein